LLHCELSGNVDPSALAMEPLTGTTEFEAKSARKEEGGGSILAQKTVIEENRFARTPVRFEWRQIRALTSLLTFSRRWRETEIFDAVLPPMGQRVSS
jgi:hypothetical protein